MSNSEKGLAIQDGGHLTQEDFEKLSDEEREQYMHQSASTGSAFEKSPYIIMDRDVGKTFGNLMFRQNDEKKYIEGNEVEVIVATIDHYWRPDYKHRVDEDTANDDSKEYHIDFVPTLLGLPDDVAPVLYRHTFPFKTFDNGVEERRRFIEVEDAVELTNGNIDKAVKLKYGIVQVKRLHVFVKNDEGNWNYEVPVIMSCGGHHYTHLIRYLNKPEFQNFVVKVKSLIKDVPDHKDPKKLIKMPVFDYEITEEALTKEQQYQVLQFRGTHAKALVEAFGSKVTVEEVVREEADVSIDSDPAAND